VTVSFTPAPGTGWAAVVADAFVVASEDADAVARVAPILSGDGGFESALDALVEGGVSRLPQLAILDLRGDGVRVLLRGATTLVTRRDDAEARLTGTGVATWAEQSLEAVDAWRLEVPGGAWSGGASTATPGDGRAEADADAERADSGAAASTPVAAPGIEPEPEPEPEPSAEPEPADDAPTGSGIVEDTIVTQALRTIGAPVTSEATIVPGSAPDETVVRPLDDARGADAAPPAGGPGDVLAGDHDGLTVASAEVRTLLAARDAAGGDRPRAGATASASAGDDGDSDRAVEAPRIELADGVVEPLDQPLVVGRAPSAAATAGAELPRLVRVGGDDPDISRTHARIAVEGGTVVVTDLHSRNGTIVVLPGRSPQRLRAGEATAVLPDTVVDLGGGVTLTVRG
jgi:hypothetical protein